MKILVCALALLPRKLDRSRIEISLGDAGVSVAMEIHKLNIKRYFPIFH